LLGGNSNDGLVPIVLAYLDATGTDSAVLQKVVSYMDLIVGRAKGSLMTPATWMRHFIRAHKDYAFDSSISPRIATDLMMKCHRIGSMLEQCPELLGGPNMVHADLLDSQPEPVSSLTLDTRKMAELVDSYRKRYVD